MRIPLVSSPCLNKDFLKWARCAGHFAEDPQCFFWFELLALAVIYSVQLRPGGGNNSFTAYALFGRGASNFSSRDDFGRGPRWRESLSFLHPGFGAGRTIDVAT